MIIRKTCFLFSFLFFLNNKHWRWYICLAFLSLWSEGSLVNEDKQSATNDLIIMYLLCNRRIAKGFKKVIFLLLYFFIFFETWAFNKVQVSNVNYDIPNWVECLPMVRETSVQSQVASYQRLLKRWYLIPPCLTLNDIRHEQSKERTSSLLYTSV